MSASLVGSEMCIRDSWKISLCRGPLAYARMAQVLNKGYAAAARGPSSMAVSYTHLTLPTICSV
eukprot:10952356-Alexandrium_andersonii.AAC.1